MKWGLIALNGKTHSVQLLKERVNRTLKEGTLECVIGVDGGCKLLETLSLVPNIILGDFDSIENLQKFKALWPSADIMIFPSEKDYTDAELAFDVMGEKKMDRVLVVGGFGGRVDHMMSILHLLGNASNYVMIDEQNYIEKIVTPYRAVFTKEATLNNYVSLIPMSEGLYGVTLEGFKYPLNNAAIEFAQTLGISNEIVETEGVVTIRKGQGYLVISSD